MNEEDEVMQWTHENFREMFPEEHPQQYHIEQQLFMLIYYDYMQMHFNLSGGYPSEACNLSWMAAHTAYSYSWLI